MNNLLSEIKKYKQLKDINKNDCTLHLIIDLIEHSRKIVLDNIVSFHGDTSILKDVEKLLCVITNMIYKEESDFVKDKDDKDYWLLSILCRKYIADKAFKYYVEHSL